MRIIGFFTCCLLIGDPASAECGDRGGPGYRGPSGRCVGSAKLAAILRQHDARRKRSRPAPLTRLTTVRRLGMPARMPAARPAATTKKSIPFRGACARRMLAPLFGKTSRDAREIRWPTPMISN
jgi:hypothetical protein